MWGNVILVLEAWNEFKPRRRIKVPDKLRIGGYVGVASGIKLVLPSRPLPPIISSKVMTNRRSDRISGAV
jgi:hypothetical protein